MSKHWIREWNRYIDKSYLIHSTSQAKLLYYSLTECNATSFDTKLAYCEIGRYDEISEDTSCNGEKKIVVETNQTGKCRSPGNVLHIYYSNNKDSTYNLAFAMNLNK